MNCLKGTVPHTSKGVPFFFARCTWINGDGVAPWIE